MNELMDRLAAANPMPADEPQTAAEQGEIDALLERILATPEAPAAPRRTLVRRVAPAAALLAAVVVAVVVVIDLVGSEEDGGIVDRALAAVSQEDVIYAVTERRISTSRPLTPDLEVAPGERGYVDYWLWSGDERSRFLTYDMRVDGSRGRLESEVTADERRLTWFMARSNTISVREPPRQDPDDEPLRGGFPGFSPFSEPGAQLRAEVDKGRLRVAGRTTVRGRSAYRLVSERRSGPGFGDERVTYFVDARTYLPLELRVRIIFKHSRFEPGGGGRELARLRIEYLRYETLPVTDENKALLEMGEHPGARVMDGP